MAASSTVPTYTLDGTLAPLEIGGMVGTFLFGLLTLQTFNYYRQFPQDSRLLKLTIASTWLLELGHTICSLQAIFWITVTTHDRTPRAIVAEPPQSLYITLVFSGGIHLLFQLFFGNRIRVLSGRLHVFLLCIAFGTLRFIIDVTIMTLIWIDNAGFLILNSKIRWEMITASTLGPVADCVIAFSMCYYLWQLRGFGFEVHRTRTIVDTLIIWTVETTLVTSLAGILQLIFFITRKDLSFAAVYLIQPKLFSNSMLAALHGRAHFRSTEESQQNAVSGLLFSPARTRNRRDEVTALETVPSDHNSHGSPIQMSRIPATMDQKLDEKSKSRLSIPGDTL
ncbi:hypothetical protein FB451DRAFT_1238522 [Mycena latifolia]|nr:hypothetical protein FB451DRAFT_1238522 [Mycena latifolia]